MFKLKRQKRFLVRIILIGFNQPTWSLSGMHVYLRENLSGASPLRELLEGLDGV